MSVLTLILYLYYIKDFLVCQEVFHNFFKKSFVVCGRLRMGLEPILSLGSP